MFHINEEILLKLNKISKDEHYLNRYVKFIQSRTAPTSEHVERHHILPRSLFQEHIKDKDNIISLTCREHFICHWMLAKLTRSDKMWFAFNQMRRIGNTSVLYSLAREYISGAISRANTGRIFTAEQRKIISLSRQNTLVVKGLDGINYRINKNHDDYKTGKVKSYRCGYRHNEETKIKMSKSGKGKICYTNGENNLYLRPDVCSPDGFVRGTSEASKLATSISFKDMLWYHDPITKKNKRYKAGETVPCDLVKGRYFSDNPGFRKANTMFNIVDLKNRVCTKVEKLESFHAPQSGLSTSKTYIYIHNNYIYTSVTMLYNSLWKQELYIDGGCLSHKQFDKIPITAPHYHNKEHVRKFKEIHHGKFPKDFGITKIKLTDFEYKETMIIYNDK